MLHHILLACMASPIFWRCVILTILSSSYPIYLCSQFV
jgi:hypothetical protein